MKRDKTPEGGESMRPPAMRPPAMRPPASTEDDVEGHRLPASRGVGGDSMRPPAMRPPAMRPPASTEDDVEGHNIGYGSPMLARDVFRAREREMLKESARDALIREAKQVIKRKR